MENWLSERTRPVAERITMATKMDLYPFFRPFEIGGVHTTIAGRPLINFSSNDYLGLTCHPKVKEAACDAVRRFGVGMSSSRVQATADAHIALEERLADYFGYPSAITFTTGYQAMVGTIMALADRDVTIILDQLSHACVLDGSFLAAGTPRNGAEVRFFNHNSVRSLERALATKERPHALVVIEGLYSLDGDLAKLPGIVEVCERHGAVLLLDDAHGSGTLGATGRGVMEHYGLQNRAPLFMTAFSKTFGGIGGVVLGSSDALLHIKHVARAFLFSASLPVPVVAAVSEILTMLEEDGATLVSELNEKASYMRSCLRQVGFDLGLSESHIMPIMCRNEAATMLLNKALFDHGVILVPVPYPAVKQGEERLRLNVTRGHTRDDIDQAVSCLETNARKFGILPAS